MLYLHKASVRSPYLQEQRLGCRLRCLDKRAVCCVPAPVAAAGTTGIFQHCLALEIAHPNYRPRRTTTEWQTDRSVNPQARFTQRLAHFQQSGWNFLFERKSLREKHRKENISNKLCKTRSNSALFSNKRKGNPLLHFPPFLHCAFQQVC